MSSSGTLAEETVPGVIVTVIWPVDVRITTEVEEESPSMPLTVVSSSSGMSTVVVTSWVTVMVVSIVEVLVMPMDAPVMCVIPDVESISAIVLVDTGLIEPYSGNLEDDTTLFLLLVVEEAVTSEDEPKVDVVSVGLEDRLKRLVGMGRRVLRVKVSLNDELLLDGPVELLMVSTAVEPVPGIFPDEIDVPA